MGDVGAIDHHAAQQHELGHRRAQPIEPSPELHISNIHRREPYYHRSYVSFAATAVIAGLGAKGYPAAIRAMRDLTQG